jgi:hypothetical protein
VNRLHSFLRHHVIALLALTLVVGGGAAFAAGTTLPKNSVASKQVKNNSLKGKDLKDRSVTGTDLRDGTVTGADLGASTVAAGNLAPGAVDEIHTYYYSSGSSDNVVWSDPAVGTLTFSYDCGTSAVSSFVSAVKSPARAGVYGLEDRNTGTEAPAATPLVGAATVSRLGDVGMPVGGAGFGGSPFGFGQLVLFVQSARVDVYADLKISLCSARGTILVDHKPVGSVIEARPGGTKASSCDKSGAGYCTEPTD